MIQSIRLKNWQIHKELFVEFDPRVTTIIGATDTGKSSLFRAIRWALTGGFPGPAGSYIHWNSQFAKVSVVVDGKSLVRKRTSATTLTLDGKSFKAFGDSQPEEISSLLNITEATFQEQFDAHFWLSETAGTVAREMNRIANLSDIDTVTSQISKELTLCKRDLERSVQKQAAIRLKVDALSPAERADSALKRIEVLTAEKITCERKRSRLAAFLGDADALKQRVEKATLPSFSGVQKVKRRLEEVARKKDALARLLSSIPEQRTVQIPALPSIAEFSKVQANRSKLTLLIEQSSKAYQRHLNCVDIAIQLKSELAQLTKGRCPLCKRKN